MNIWKLTVVLDLYEDMETYSRIGLLRSYGNLQSYWTTTKLWKLSVVLDYYEAIETYSRIQLDSGDLRKVGTFDLFRSQIDLQTEINGNITTCTIFQLGVLKFFLEKNSTRNECVLKFGDKYDKEIDLAIEFWKELGVMKTTLETGGEDYSKIHSQRV